MGSKPRIGIVGAGRTRNGLGPFLARAFERAGTRVVGVAGRDPAGAGRGAATVAAHLGHPVAAASSVRELADTVDLLVVASPAAAHLQGLQAALDAGIACLCEKPLVLPEQADRGLELVAAFGERELPLVENCQWPMVLPTIFGLYPELSGAAVESVEMGLSPAAGGRAMVLDSLSHVLSVVQALTEVDPAGTVRAVQQTDAGATAERNTVSFEMALTGPWHGRTVAVELRLERRDSQPRPAWITINGHRVDRRIGENYSQFLTTADGREERMPDPLDALVYRLPALLTPSARDDARTHRRAIATRLRCFCSVVAAVGRAVS